MKLKFVSMLLLVTLAFSACGSDAAASDAASTSSVSEESTNSSTESTDALSDLAAVGDIEVDTGIFDVELTIPAEWIGETTQEELTKTASEHGYQSITLNSDGSATYVMTKKQHKDLMKEMADSLNESLDELIGSESYPNFTAIKSNDDFTEFTITTKSTELDMAESFSALAFYMYGGMYNVFNGTPVDNISVTYINADSGEVISTANSADAAE